MKSSLHFFFTCLAFSYIRPWRINLCLQQCEYKLVNSTFVWILLYFTYMHLCLIPFRVSYRSLFFLFGPLMPLMVIACQSTRWWWRLGPKRRWLKRSWLSATSAWWWIWKENSIAHITSEQTHWTAGRQRMSSFLCNIFTLMLYTCYVYRCITYDTWTKILTE